MVLHYIIENIITYGESIWGWGNLSKAALNKLFTLQRIFVLQISCGYKIISIDAFNIVIGIPPIFITIKYEFIKNNILHLENEAISKQYFPQMTIQSMIPDWQMRLPTSK